MIVMFNKNILLIKVSLIYKFCNFINFFVSINIIKVCHPKQDKKQTPNKNFGYQIGTNNKKLSQNGWQKGFRPINESP